MKTRVCVADPVSFFRAGAREVLRREQDFEVSEAADLIELERALMEGIDIVLLDSCLPPGEIGDAIGVSLSWCKAVVVWSLRPDPDAVLTAVRLGASGYLTKEISPLGLVRSLRGAAHGEAPFSRNLTTLLIGAIHRAELAGRARELTGLLSPREREVLAQLAQGARNKQIAVELAISEFTVKRHVQNILHKLELPSRRAAAGFCGSLGCAPLVGAMREGF